MPAMWPRKGWYPTRPLNRSSSYLHRENMETGTSGREDHFTMRACVYIMALATSAPRVPTSSNMAHFHTFSSCHMILWVLDVLGEREIYISICAYIYIWPQHFPAMYWQSNIACTWLAGPPWSSHQVISPLLEGSTHPLKPPLVDFSSFVQYCIFETY